jgi:GNAT superfamily N-acetyltransferase
MHVAPLDAAHLPSWGALFTACGSACFCRYWHFVGTKNDWLARCAFTPETNFEEHAAVVSEISGRGLIAVEDERVLGWMKLAPRSTLPKLRALPVYRSLDLGPDEGVYSIGCMLVHPEHRHRGITRALVNAAETHVRAWGGTAIEAYPRRAREPLHDEEAWMGPENVFVECGFEPVAGETPYPVYRRVL